MCQPTPQNPYVCSLPIASLMSFTPPNLSRSAIALEDVRPALLLRPRLLIVCLSMYLQLLQVRIDDFFPAVRALFTPAIATISSVLGGELVLAAYPRWNSQRRTIEVGFGALTGRPFAFTGARVPAASAFLISRDRTRTESAHSELSVG